MAGFSMVQLQFMPAAKLAGQTSLGLGGVLGAACFGAAPPDSLAALDLPLACVRVAPLFAGATPPAAAICEVWTTDAPLRQGAHGRLRYRCSEEVLFGALSVPLADAAPDGAVDMAPAMQRAAEQAYTALFAAVEALGFPHLLRVWNHVPDINGHSAGLEHYRLFNIGRQDAFLAFDRRIAGASVPAASALGAQDGSALVVYGMAARRPAVALENPRQISAYDYPLDYGPRAPTFSRANLARIDGQSVLFISGTASIVGHQTLHAGDAAMQTRETLRNIEALLQQAAGRGAAGLSLEHLHYKVYVRHAHDLPAARAELERAAGGGARVLYLQADVCRADLLVEIEAVAFPAEQESPC